MGRILALPAVDRPSLQTARRSRLRSGSATSAAGTDVVAEPRIHLAAAGQDEHHGPVASCQTPVQTSLVGQAGLGRVRPDGYGSRSGANCCRASAGIDLGVEEVGHRPVVELDVDPGRTSAARATTSSTSSRSSAAAMPNPPISRLTRVTQEQQFGPGGRREPQDRVALGRHWNHSVLLHGNGDTFLVGRGTAGRPKRGSRCTRRGTRRKSCRRTTAQGMRQPAQWASPQPAR